MTQSETVWNNDITNSVSRDQLNSSGTRPALAHIAEEGVWDVQAGDEDDCEDHPFATQKGSTHSVSHVAGSVPAHS